MQRLEGSIACWATRMDAVEDIDGQGRMTDRRWWGSEDSQGCRKEGRL